MSERGFPVSVVLPPECIRKLDLLAAHEQQERGPVRRISRSAVVRSILDRHFAALDGAASAASQIPVRVRRRKPDGA